MGGHHLGWWVILVPVVGGLVVGVMAKYGSRKIKGHGIPEAMEAVLVNRSRIEPKVAILKPISAAIAIGTGGPFGAEGPIIQTGGALGSLVGQVLHTTAVGAQGAAGLRRGGRNVGDIQHADCGRDSRDRVAAVRIQVAFVYSAGDRQYAGHCGAHAVAGPGADVFRVGR